MTNHRHSIPSRKLPSDIKPQWLNVIRRVQSVARNNDGLGIIQMKVMVDQNGNPIFWIEPQMVKLEPKTTVDFELLRKKFTDEEFKLMLQEMFNH